MFALCICLVIMVYCVGLAMSTEAPKTPKGEQKLKS